MKPYIYIYINQSLVFWGNIFKYVVDRCVSVLPFPSAIVLTYRLGIMASDYSFGIFMLLWNTRGFLRIRYNWHIVESGAKHHNPNPKPWTNYMFINLYVVWTTLLKKQISKTTETYFFHKYWQLEIRCLKILF